MIGTRRRRRWIDHQAKHRPPHPPPHPEGLKMMILTMTMTMMIMISPHQEECHQIPPLRIEKPVASLLTRHSYPCCTTMTTRAGLGYWQRISLASLTMALLLLLLLRRRKKKNDCVQDQRKECFPVSIPSEGRFVHPRQGLR